MPEPERRPERRAPEQIAEAIIPDEAIDLEHGDRKKNLLDTRDFLALAAREAQRESERR